MRKGHLTSEVGGQGIRMDAECTGLWVWLEERKFSFKNSFLCWKRHWGRGRTGKCEVEGRLQGGREGTGQGHMKVALSRL